MKTGSINHIAITVYDLEKSKSFYEPFLKLLGYELKLHLPDDGTKPTSYYGCYLFGNDKAGTWVNLWQKAPEATQSFNRYEVGLHHIAFHVETNEELEDIFSYVNNDASCDIIELAKDYPEYGPNYRSFFFNDCNGIKLEVVSMAC